MPDLTTLQQRLKKIQDDAKAIDVQRERLAREAHTEEHKLKESIKRLQEVGISDAAKLSDADLEALRAKTEATLEASVETVTLKIAEANRVLAEYDAVIQAA